MYYRPRLRYVLLEERQYTEAELAPLHNLVAALFRLETVGPAEIERVLAALADWLRALKTIVCGVPLPSGSDGCYCQRGCRRRHSQPCMT